MRISGEGYEVTYHAKTAKLTLRGILRLNRVEYAPIVQFLNWIAAMKPALITIDLQELKFLNSSGISVLSKFVIKVRKLKSSKILVLGNSQISWQSKSLKNLRKLMREMRVEFAI